MKTIIKTIIAIILIIIGLTALFTIDNAQDITTLLVYTLVMVIGIVLGIALLTSAYPELADSDEYDEYDKIFNEYENELEALREENLLLFDRYSTFREIIRYSNLISQSKYPNLYELVYNEKVKIREIGIKESTLEELNRFEEIYN